MPKAVTSRNQATSSSKKLRAHSTQSTPTGRVVHQRVLGPKEIRASIAESNAARRQKYAPGPLSEADIPELESENREELFYDGPDALVANDMGAVLDGTASIDVSHAGGEFEDILEDCLKEDASRPLRKDQRTRRDRTESRTQAFKRQMTGIVDAYLAWSEGMGEGAMNKGPSPSSDGLVDGVVKLRVMDVFQTYTYAAHIVENDSNVPAALIRHGLLPSAPLKPTFAFSIRAAELYRVTHLRCPHLAIEPFVKGLCDLHRVPFRRYLSEQFSIAFDLYLSIHAAVKSRVDIALGRDLPNWRLKNACSACTYKLEGEADLTFKMLVAMDGNDSLKRLRCCETLPPREEDQEPRIPKSRARQDTRTAPGDYYLTRESVDRWAKAALEEVLPADVAREEIEENPCVGRWTNMINEVTAKMWGIFGETGVFLALCRHGFALVVADMVQSGELSKYPLAVVEALLDAFGEDLGNGYDIGCKFKTTVDKSDLGARARELRFRALVGAFHGHAHNRICQLSNLATYVKGMGLEDLEGCERFFSKSNALASSVRYASVFHRQQKIVEYMAHTDAFETQHNLSSFLVNNYRQALELLAGEGALRKTMEDQGIAGPEVFVQWLQEERVYLSSLTKEPIQETLEMEYYQKLVNLRASELKLSELKSTWHTYDPAATAPSAPRQPGAKRQYSPETRLRHAKEAVDRGVAAVQELELELGVVDRWTPTSQEWKAAAVMVGRRRYQRCLDDLEALVVSRMFELTKMNMSQTGYKLRKHISKALKARSQAIRSALERYNTAAALLSPPRPSLSWEEVVEYAFLADFDLLRDSRQDVRERPWAKPAARLAMDRYFKMERAREEIRRLNIEIKRVMTHMQDEEAFLSAKVTQLRRTHPALAYQVDIYREKRTRFYEIHRRRFKKLASNPLFTGSLVPGTPLDKTLLDLDVAMDVEERPLSQSSQDPPHNDDDDICCGDEGRARKEQCETEDNNEDDDNPPSDNDDNDGWDAAEEGVGLLAEALDAFSLAAH